MQSGWKQETLIFRDPAISPWQLSLPSPTSPGGTHPSAYSSAPALCSQSGFLATFVPLDVKLLTGSSAIQSVWEMMC